MDSIIDVSIRFRLPVIAIAAGIMVLGILQLSRMPVDVLPETSPVVADIQAEAAGLPAPEVESLVTVPLEKNLLEGVLGVTDVTSDSVPGLVDPGGAGSAPRTGRNSPSVLALKI